MASSSPSMASQFSGEAKKYLLTNEVDLKHGLIECRIDLSPCLSQWSGSNGTSESRTIMHLLKHVKALIQLFVCSILSLKG